MSSSHQNPPDSLSDSDSRRIQAAGWLVLLSAFAVFVALLIGVPWLGLRYLRTATVAESAFAEPKSGSLAIESRSGIRVLREGEGSLEVYEQTTVSTDKSARAFVRFFDGSTLSLDPDASVTVESLRRPRFTSGEESRRIELHATGRPGAATRMWVGTTWGDLEFSVVTDENGTVTIAPESHAWIELDPELMTVQVQDGEATVTNAGESVVLQRDQRVHVWPGRVPSGRAAGPENVVVNGDFGEPPSEETGWMFDRTPPREQSVSPGESRHAVDDTGRTLITFERSDSQGTSADMFYRQFLSDIDVTSSSFIGVSATLRVLDQSLQGGGIQQSEFPVLIKLIFEADGVDHPWVVGFYVIPPEMDNPDDPRLIKQHIEVPRGTWYTFESGNLLGDSSFFGFARRDPPLPNPITLKRVEVVASGHDYSSEIDKIGVWVK